MPTISELSTVFTEIVVFTVEPEQQQALIDVIVGEVERWVKHRPGFISATYHKSFDGTKVVNYAQWISQDDWKAFTEDSQSAVLGEKIKQLGVKGADAHSYSGFQLDEVQWQPVNSDTLAQAVYSAYLKSAVSSSTGD